MTFDGDEIFGTQTKLLGPFTSYRTQRETLPGVNGARQYRLGKGTVLWTVQGRLSAPTLADLHEQLRLAQSYIDGMLYVFTDNADGVYDNCALNDFRPVGNYINTGFGFTVAVQATVEWLAPTDA